MRKANPEQTATRALLKRAEKFGIKKLFVRSIKEFYSNPSLVGLWLSNESYELSEMFSATNEFDLCEKLTKFLNRATRKNAWVEPYDSGTIMVTFE